MLADVIGWVGTIGVLVGYVASAKRGRHWIDWSNALLFPLVMAPAVLRGAYSSAFVAFSFGMTAWVALRKRKRDGTD